MSDEHAAGAPEDGAYVPLAYPKLLVTDAERTVTFYTNLGFTLVHRDPLFAHLRWKRYADLYLVSTPAGYGIEGRRGVGVILCFDARDHRLEEVALLAQAAGASTDGPRDTPWHTRELLVMDPEGYRLSFVTPA